MRAFLSPISAGDTGLIGMLQPHHPVILFLDFYALDKRTGKVTAPYSFERHLQMSSPRTVILFLVEWDLDSGSAPYVVGLCFWGAKSTQLTIAYRCSCIHAFSPPCTCLAILSNGLFETPVMACVESRSKSRPLLCALVTQCAVLS